MQLDLSVKKQKQANETADENIRRMAQAEVWNLREKFEEAFKVLAAKPSETPMAMQAKAFASGIVSSVESSITDVLKGKMSVKDGIRGILDTFTSNIIDTFVKGLTSPFTGESGIITSALRSFGSNIFSSFSRKDTEQPVALPVQEASLGSVSESASILEGISSTLSSGFSGITGFLGSLVAGFTSMLGLNTAEMSTAQMQLIYLGQLGITIPAAIVTGTATMVTAIATAAATITATMVTAIATAAATITAAIATASVSDSAGGILRCFAEGGRVSGAGTGTSDSIPAMLSNGEFVVNADATRKNLKLLKAINENKLPKFAEGGYVGISLVETPMYIPIEKPTQPVANQQVINLTITGDISRQTRAEIYQMLPSIAAGVNSYNREKGVR